MNTLQQIIDTIDARPTVAAYCAGNRQIAALSGGLPAARIALLASYTIAPLIPFLQVETARLGLRGEVYQSAFNTVRQELLNPAGECARFAPDVVFVAELLQDVCPDLADGWVVRDAVEVATLIETAVASIVAAITVFRASSNASIVVHNFAWPRHAAMGLADSMMEVSQLDAINQLNHRMGVTLSAMPGVYVLDLCHVAARIGLAAWHDDRMWLLARAPFSTAALVAIARAHASFASLLLQPQRKCLALDLDNTLWGGVVGEVGASGLALGPEYPGNAFVQFQQFILSLYHRGVVLALLSKNNQEDVDEVFDSHPGMILKREHFAAARINWQPKTENLASIATQLSLGTDSFVFFDDDAAECAWMQEARPEVLTVQAPRDITRCCEAIIATGAFERLSLTREDRRRGELYAARDAGRLSAAAAVSVPEFLDSLAMRAVVQPADARQLPRVADLIGKTNQFNLTSRRYSPAAVAAMRNSGTHEIFSLQLSDRFGDNGIVGVAIVRCEAAEAVLDTLLLSCRVIGRKAETALLASVAAWARERGITALIGEFVATAKNAPAADCYERHGFEPLPGDAAMRRFRLTLDEHSLPWPSCIATSTGVTV